MNRFQIALGKEEDFEKIWRDRETHLDKVPGFKSFNLIKGDSNETFTLYASHSTWKSKKDFLNWTKSEEFEQPIKARESTALCILGIQFLKVLRL